MSKTLNTILATMRLATQLLRAGEYEASCRQSDKASKLLREELGTIAPLSNDKPKT